MLNNEDLENTLSGQHAETHPREEHRRALREQMLSTFRRHKQPSPAFRRPFLRRWCERAAVLAAGVILGVGIGSFFRTKTTANSTTATPSPVVLVMESSPTRTAKTSRTSFWDDEQLKKYWAKSHSDSQQPSRPARRRYSLSELIGELQ